MCGSSSSPSYNFNLVCVGWMDGIAPFFGLLVHALKTRIIIRCSNCKVKRKSACTHAKESKPRVKFWNSIILLSFNRMTSKQSWKMFVFTRIKHFKSVHQTQSKSACIFNRFFSFGAFLMYQDQIVNETQQPPHLAKLCTNTNSFMFFVFWLNNTTSLPNTFYYCPLAQISYWIQK